MTSVSKSKSKPKSVARSSKTKSKKAVKTVNISELLLSSKGDHSKSEDITSITTASIDDHQCSPPATPSKETSKEGKGAPKRGRKAVKKDILKELSMLLS